MKFVKPPSWKHVSAFLGDRCNGISWDWLRNMGFLYPLVSSNISFEIPNYMDTLMGKSSIYGNNQLQMNRNKSSIN